MKLGIAAIHKNYIGISRKELIKALQEMGYSISYLGQGSNKENHPDFKSLDVRFIELPIIRANYNPIVELRTLLKVIKTLKRNNFDNLIVYGIRTFPIMVFAGKFSGIKKIICIVNGTGQLFGLRGIKGLLVRLISLPFLWLSFLLTDFVFFQNPDDLALIKKKFFLWKQNYDRINGSGINLEFFHFIPLEKKPVFTMISRLTGVKGVNEYIQAASKVKAVFPDAVFRLIGPMDDRDKSISQQTFQSAIDEGIIEHIGRVDDVLPHLVKSRVFVLPSFYREGIPRTILEAMAVGRPIITTDWPGCRETVIDGVNGFLVPVKDSDALAEKMLWMIENPDDAAKMGRESRRIAEEEFDVHKVNSIITSKIHQLDKA